MRPCSARCTALTRGAATASTVSPTASHVFVVAKCSLAAVSAASVSASHPRLHAAHAGMRLCAASRYRGAGMAAVRMLVTAQRHVSTDNRGDKSAANMSREEFAAAFGSYPLGERLAALTVAQFIHGSRFNASAPYMPLTAFMRKVSAVTRDDMLRRQLDALEYVAASQLMTLVSEKGDHVPLSSLRSSGGGGGGDGAAAGTPPFTGVLYINVTVPVLWVMYCASSRSGYKRADPEKAAAAQQAAAESVRPKSLPNAHADARVGSGGGEAMVLSEGATRGVAGDATVREAATRKALLHYLHRWDARRGAARQAGAANVPRYVPLATLYSDIIRGVVASIAARSDTAEPSAEQDEELGMTFTDAELQVLQALRAEALEAVAQKLAVMFTVGRRAGTEEEALAGYPTIEARPLWLTRGPKPPFPCFIALRYPAEPLPPRFRYVQPRIVTSTRQNNYGGWGGEQAVPTKADVYEVLKYVPVNWGAFSTIQMPPELRKKHIRSSSSSLWYRRQPFYFELRDMRGILEIRRSIVLHPEAHGLTKEDAWEILEMQLATGEANHMMPVNEDGALLRPAENLFDKAVTKFLYRVCPAYFAPLTLTLQRSSRQNVTEPVLFSFVQRYPQDFEVLRTRFSDIPLVRRRAGAESSRWRDDFLADLERYPEDVRGILVLCNYLCPGWDRPGYVYVRLSDDEQGIVGGYTGMVNILGRHPMLFRVGKHFVCRADPSNPLAHQQAEPAPSDATALAGRYEENPYISHRELALVFHYVMPEGEPCTAAYLVDCASPVMRVELPPRVVIVLQAFPKLFACTETSPGVYSIRKLRQPSRRAPGAPAKSTAGPPDASTASGGDGAAEAEAIQMLEDELADEDHMTRAETIQAIRMLIPDAGVDAAQLLMWASMSVQRAASQYGTSLLRLIAESPQDFRVVENEHVKMIYKR